MTTPNALSLPLLENKSRYEVLSSSGGMTVIADYGDPAERANFTPPPPEPPPTVFPLNNGWSLEIYDGYRYADRLTGDVGYGWEEDGDDQEELWEEVGELVLYCGPTEEAGRLCDSLDVYSYLEKILPWVSIGDAENYHTVDRVEMEEVFNTEFTLEQAKERIIMILEEHGCVPLDV